MTVQALEIKRSSAAMWGTKTGLREKPVVSKYIDTTTCIGCKACEAACQEWNDLKTVATHQEDVTPEEMDKRMAAAGHAG